MVSRHMSSSFDVNNLGNSSVELLSLRIFQSTASIPAFTSSKSAFEKSRDQTNFSGSLEGD